MAFAISYGISLLLFLLDVSITFTSGNDLEVLRFTVTSPVEYSDQYLAGTDIMFDLEIANPGSTDIETSEGSGPVYSFLMYTADHYTQEGLVSSLGQTITQEKGDYSQVPGVGSSLTFEGMTANVVVSRDCNIYNYLCVELEPILYNDSNPSNNVKCIRFGNHEENKAGEKVCEAPADEEDENNGVYVSFSFLSIDVWIPFLASYRRNVASAVNNYCLNNEKCCESVLPNSDFVQDEHVRIGTGHPKIIGNFLSILTDVASPNAFCPGSGRKRRVAGYTYLSQQILEMALTDNINSLAVNGIEPHEISLLEIEAENVSSVATSTMDGKSGGDLRAWEIAVIIIVVLFAGTGLMILAFMAMPSRKQKTLYQSWQMEKYVGNTNVPMPNALEPITEKKA